MVNVSSILTTQLKYVSHFKFKTMQRYIVNGKFYGWLTEDGKLSNNYDYNGNQLTSDKELKELIKFYE